MHMKVPKRRKTVKKKKSFYGENFIKQNLQASWRCLCSAAYKLAAWLEIPQRAPGTTSPRSRMPGDLGISPPSRLNYSTRNSFLQCCTLSRLLCNSVSIQQSSVLSTQNPPSLVGECCVLRESGPQGQTFVSVPGPQPSPRPVDPSPHILYWSSSSWMV